MTLKYLIANLEALKDKIDIWIKELQELEDKDIKRFFKKGIKAPSIRIRSKLKNIADECTKHRKMILQYRKEMELLSESPLKVNYRKTRRKKT